MKRPSPSAHGTKKPRDLRPPSRQSHGRSQLSEVSADKYNGLLQGQSWSCSCSPTFAAGVITRKRACASERGIGDEMGIKFHCPNGHKLHVKAFLRGKRTICPKCGVRVLVPEESESSATAQVAVMQEVDSPFEENVDEILSRDGASHGTVATSVPTATSPPTSSAPLALNGAIAPATLASTSAAATTVPGLTLTAVAAPVVPAATPPTQDPFQEAPAAVWYYVGHGWTVWPGVGRDHDPPLARRGANRHNSLVWRAGWPDWRSAAATFPQLGAPWRQPGVAVPQAAAVTSATMAARRPAPCRWATPCKMWRAVCRPAKRWECRPRCLRSSKRCASGKKIPTAAWWPVPF